MKLVVVAGLVALLAHAAMADPGPHAVRSPEAEDDEPEPGWYGWQIAALDLGGAVIDWTWLARDHRRSRAALAPWAAPVGDGVTAGLAGQF